MVHVVGLTAGGRAHILIVLALLQQQNVGGGPGVAPERGSTGAPGGIEKERQGSSTP